MQGGRREILKEDKNELRSVGRVRYFLRRDWGRRMVMEMLTQAQVIWTFAESNWGGGGWVESL